MVSRSKKHSIEVANRSSLKEERIGNPGALAPTFAVIGEFQTPLEVQDNQPDMAMVHQVRELLGYKSNITILEWWRIFPVRKWWAFALQATRHLCRKANYKYFLLSLLTAARGGEKFQQFQGLLKRVLGKVAEVVQGQKPVRPVCNCSGVCEKCHPLLQAFERELAEWQSRRWEIQGGRS